MDSMYCTTRPTLLAADAYWYAIVLLLNAVTTCCRLHLGCPAGLPCPGSTLGWRPWAAAARRARRLRRRWRRLKPTWLRGWCRLSRTTGGAWAGAGLCVHGGVVPGGGVPWRLTGKEKSELLMGQCPKRGSKQLPPTGQHLPQTRSHLGNLLRVEQRCFSSSNTPCPSAGPAPASAQRQPWPWLARLLRRARQPCPRRRPRRPALGQQPHELHVGPGAGADRGDLAVRLRGPGGGGRRWASPGPPPERRPAAAAGHLPGAAWVCGAERCDGSHHGALQRAAAGGAGHGQRGAGGVWGAGVGFGTRCRACGWGEGGSGADLVQGFGICRSA